jgi:hypothetical protein
MAKRLRQVMQFKVTLLEIEPPDLAKDSGTQHVLILRPARGNTFVRYTR